MRSLLLGREIREDELPGAFLLHGGDPGLAREVLRELLAALKAGGGEEPVFERFVAGADKWSDIIDVARTLPFFFSPWRVLSVEIADSDGQDMRAAEAKMLAGYLAAPTGRTLLVVIMEEKPAKTSALMKAFAGAPKDKVQVVELRKPNAAALTISAEKALAERGKRASAGVIAELVAASDRDLAKLSNQIEMLATYVGERKTIEESDLDALIPSVKEYGQWAMYGALDRGATAEALSILASEFDDGAPPMLIVGQIGGYLRGLLLAKSLLREGKSRLEVLQEMNKREGFLQIVDAFTDRRLNRLIEELQAVDLKIKSTDGNARTLIESFLAYYGRMRKRGGVTSPGRG